MVTNTINGITDYRTLTSSIADLSLHIEKLHEILIRFTNALIISDKDTVGSGCDLSADNLFAGFVFQANQTYLIKSGTYIVDTANGAFLSFQNGASLVAQPGEQVRILGTDAKSPFLIEGTLIPLTSAFVPCDVFGTPTYGVSTPYGLVALGGLLNIQNLYDINDPSKTVYVDIVEQDVANTNLYFNYVRRFKQVISDTVFEMDQPLKSEPAGNSVFNAPFFAITVDNIVLDNIITTVTAFGVSNSTINFQSEYRDAYDQRLFDLEVIYDSILTHSFRVNPEQTKREILSVAPGVPPTLLFWPNPFSAFAPDALMKLAGIGNSIVNLRYFELLIAIDIIHLTLFNLRGIFNCSINYEDFKSRIGLLMTVPNSANVYNYSSNQPPPFAPAGVDSFQLVIAGDSASEFKILGSRNNGHALISTDSSIVDAIWHNQGGATPISVTNPNGSGFDRVVLVMDT